MFKRQKHLCWINNAEPQQSRKTFTANVSLNKKKRAEMFRVLFRNVERSRNIKTEELFSLF